MTHDALLRVDMEAQMTTFAYYYVGIGIGVLVLSYFQVSTFSIFSFRSGKCGVLVQTGCFLHILDCSLGDSGHETDAQDAEGVFPKSDADGNRVV